MNIRRIFRIVRKDVAVGPRSPLLLFVVLMPLIMTLVLQLVFGDLFVPQPSLAVLDQGVSQISRLIQEREGIEVVQAQDQVELKRMVADHEVDAGLVCPRVLTKRCKRVRGLCWSCISAVRATPSAVWS